MFKKLNIFLEEPGREFNVREAARILKISPATASKDLRNFVKQGLLKLRKERIFHLYRANTENDYYKDFKVFYNIKKIKDSGLIDALNKYYLKPAIVLFGSASKGEDTETSDLDLVIVSEKTKEFPKLNKFEQKIRKKIQLFRVKNIKELKNKHLVNNVLNGIVLQGRLKWT